MMIRDTYFEPGSTLTTPVIVQTGGATILMGNTAHVGASGVFASIAVDNVDNLVINNDFSSYTVSLPAEPLVGLYSSGWDGIYGQQLVLGKTTQAGRVDFRRGSDGVKTGWIGFSNASGSSNTFDVTATGGSTNVRLNAGGGGSNIFMVAGTEFARVDAQGINIAQKVAATAAPGAAFLRLAVVAGTTAGTARLVAFAGTSTVATTIADNIGAGF
jgi:hypothetical protein